MARAPITDFELANPLYKNATIAFYTVASGVKTATLATLYAGMSASAQLANPQKLNSRGQFKQAVYIANQVIGEVEGISVPGHDTGIHSAAPSFRVQQSTGKFQYSYDGDATFNDTGDYIFFNRGAWVTATDYHRNDMIVNATTIYIALVAHTSGVFADDLAASKWIAVLEAISASTGASLIGFLQAGTGAVSRTVESKLRDTVSVLDFFPVALHPGIKDGTNATELSTYIQAGIAALAARATDGTLYFPEGTYKITTAIAMAAGVNIVGAGPTVSVIAPTSCGAFTYAFTTGWGDSRIANIGIEGAGTSGNNIAIYQAGTTLDTDELYGLTIERVYIRNFDIAFKARNVRVLTITGCWFQNINSGIQLIGKIIGAYIHGNKIERATAQSGTADLYGFYIAEYAFPAGTVAPEGIRILDNQIFSFATAIYTNFSSFLNILSNDIAVTATGIRLSTSNGVTNICDNYIEVDGATTVDGIFGQDQSSSAAAPINIMRNRFVSLGGTALTTTGVRMGTAAIAGNQEHINIENNAFNGWTLADISTALSGNIRIVGNDCHSSGVTNSIYVGQVPTGRPVYIDGNYCLKAIAYDSSDDIKLGKIQYGANVEAGTTRRNFNLFGSAVYNAGNLVDGAGVTTTAGAGGDITVTGAVLGDYVLAVSCSVDLQGITLTGYVSAAGTVSLRLQNETGGAINLGSATYRAMVRQNII